MYIVKWKSKNNNEGKIGQPFVIEVEAQKFADELNKKTPSIKYWVEKR